jgi:hypothetical protein
MATLYYNAAVDTAWDTLGNWWNDIGFSDPALALPADGDDVQIYAQMDSGPSTSVTLNSIYVGAGYVQMVFTGAVGNAYFDGTNNAGYVNGNAIFNNSGQASGASTSGNCIFNGSCVNYGGIGGDATFNDYSYNTNVGADGSIGGNATFNDHSYNDGATINGNAIFNNDSYNQGVVSGNATFNDNSYNESGLGNGVSGDAAFNDYSYNGGNCYANATFNDYSYNYVFALIGGNATFNAPYTYNDGEVTGTAYFHGNYGNSGTCDGDAYFYDNTYNIGTVVGTGTFYGLATSARFNLIINNWNAYHNGPIVLSLSAPTGGGGAFPLWRLLKLPFPLNP